MRHWRRSARKRVKQQKQKQQQQQQQQQKQAEVAAGYAAEQQHDSTANNQRQE
jgi:hypothetical protein